MQNQKQEMDVGQASATSGPILLFDGVCNLCNGAVQFIIRRDPHARMRFASLQSEAGQRLLQEFGLSPSTLDSLVLIVGNRAYLRSTAVLMAARYLRMPWPLCVSFLAVPIFLRDPLYRFIARNRYRWFGRRETCMIPTPELKSRFLD